MRSLLYASSIVVIGAASSLDAQIRTPIATVSEPTTTPGPAPLNAKAVATSPTSVSVSWDATSGARAYTVDRTRTDDAGCCVAHSGLITTPGWNDGSLEATKEYSFVITALYLDGRVGSTEVVAATPAVALPAVRLPKDFEILTAAEGILRYTPCGQRNGGGPGPGTIISQTSSPAGARFHFAPALGAANYVIDRAPEGTTNWTFVGSTCGGPSRIYVGETDVSVVDYAGGVTTNARYVYRVTAVSSNGAAGWNSYHWTAPCRYLANPIATVSGSTVNLKWTSGSTCGYESSISPENYTITSDYGYTKTTNNYSTQNDVIYGVPLGTHTFTVVGNYRTGGATRPASVSVTIAY